MSNWQFCLLMSQLSLLTGWLIKGWVRPYMMAVAIVWAVLAFLSGVAT